MNGSPNGHIWYQQSISKSRFFMLYAQFVNLDISTATFPTILNEHMKYN